MKLIIFIVCFISLSVFAKKKDQKIVSVKQYRAHIEQVVTNHLSEVIACKKKTKAKGGRMVFIWEMDDKGKAHDFTRGEDSIESDPFYHCVIKKIEKWKFEKPPQGRPLDVQHLFVM